MTSVTMAAMRYIEDVKSYKTGNERIKMTSLELTGKDIFLNPFVTDVSNSGGWSLNATEDKSKFT